MIKAYVESSGGSLVPVRITIEGGEISFILLTKKDDPSIGHSVTVIEKLVEDAQSAGASIAIFNLNLPEGDRPDQLRIRLLTEK